MGPQAVVWFGIAGGAAAFGGSLLYNRYVRRTPQAVKSRGSFTLFGIFSIIFAIGAIVAGVVAAQAGR